MRKLYSLVLLAAGLLIGTNAWGALNEVQVKYESGTYADNPKTFTGEGSLQNAIKSIAEGDTATITLLGDQRLKEPVCIPYFTGDTTNWDGSDQGAAKGEKPIRERVGQKICLNLNTHTITDEEASTAIGIFQFLKGTLHLTGKGFVEHTKNAGGGNLGQSAIFLGGAPATHKQTLWTTLIIDKDVQVTATGGDTGTGDSGKTYAISIDACGYNAAVPAMMSDDKSDKMNSKAGYKTNSYKKSGSGPYDYYFYNDEISCDDHSTAGCAYGVRVFINGATLYGNQRAINIAGNINAAPQCDEDWSGKTRRNPNATPTATNNPEEYSFYYNNYYPYIKVGKDSKLLCRADDLNSGNGGIYGGGYCVYDIDRAEIAGQTGILLKSGDMLIKDSEVKSTSSSSQSSGDYGKNVAGTGIFIASDAGYAGDVKVHITGETTIQGGGEAAIVDVFSTKDGQTTNVSNITIDGGTIIPGDNGAITLTQPTASNGKTTITGGNVSGTISIGGDNTKGVEDLTPTEGYHITVIEDADGNKVYAVSEGDAPTTGNKVSNQSEGASVKWEGATCVEDEIIANQHLKLTEMEINDTITAAEHAANNSLITGAARVQTLYVRDGATLEVGRVVLGPEARVIVEAGGKFIVTGKDGIAAVADDNITLKTQEGKPSIFLLNPAVKTNRCPMAKVEFTSKAFYAGANSYVFQRFGLPTKKGGLQQITGAGNPRTRFWKYDYDGNPAGWKALGFINGTGSDAELDISNMNDPFDYYQMMNFDATTFDGVGVVYTFKGNLLGNDEPTMKILENSWKGFANSYMGVMKLSELLALIPNTVDKAIYTYNVSAVHGSWNAVNNLNSADAKLDPMQPFLIRNRYAAAEVKLNYASTVYNPTINSISSAPRRAADNNITMAQISIANENSADYVIVAEDSEFSPAFDNGYDASKFMNEEVNLYIEAEEKMSIFATNNLENTTMGVSSVLGGKYTMTFSNVKGDNLMLVDKLTGARVAMVEGNTYEFEVAANTVNDRRFVVVPMAKMPTAIENTEAVKSAKGVYTITGQFVGEDINVLPAGIYVVDGVKVVK